MILKELAEAIGPSGNEKQVRAVLRRALEGHVEQMWVDNLGNLHAVKKGTSGSGMRLLLTAHMDEVGLMVTSHDEKGGLKVRAIGGIDDRVLAGKAVWVGDERIAGVIGLKPIHLLEKNEHTQVTPLRQLVIDIGAGGKEEAKRLAPVGTTAVFATPFRDLGAVALGKAFDDRAGCAALTELLCGEPLRHTLHAVFTVQEEVGMRGARVAAYAAGPECAFVLEGTIADDLPKEKESSPTSELGKGPVITVMDRSFVAHRGLLRLMVDTAEELGIPYQFKQPGVGGTDAGAIHKTRSGVPSIAVAVPCRYIHGPVCMLQWSDLENTARLMRETLTRLTRRALRRD